jgi:hypothetical protein
MFRERRHNLGYQALVDEMLRVVPRVKRDFTPPAIDLYELGMVERECSQVHEPEVIIRYHLFPIGRGWSNPGG